MVGIAVVGLCVVCRGGRGVHEVSRVVVTDHVVVLGVVVSGRRTVVA